MNCKKCGKDRHDFIVEKDRIELAAYKKLWPMYCQQCGGKGLLSESHGSDEVWLIACEHCVEQGVCPRCGSISNNFEDDDDEPLHCASCDWRYRCASS